MPPIRGLEPYQAPAQDERKRAGLNFRALVTNQRRPANILGAKKETAPAQGKAEAALRAFEPCRCKTRTFRQMS